MIKLSAKLRDLLGTHGQMKARPLNPPVFITGCMRSGTTFLVDKLAGHPQLLKIGTELNDVWTQIGGAPCMGTCDHRGREHVDPKFAYNMTAHFAEFIKESRSLKRRAMRMSVRLSDGTVRVNYDWENIIPMNKSPHLMNKLGYVHGLFPNSKFVLIIRDIHAQCASLKRHLDNEFKKTGKRRILPADEKACWSTWHTGGGEPRERSYPHEFKTLPLMWFRLNRLAIEEVRQIPADQRIVLNYEELIADQQANLMQVFELISPLPTHQKEAEKVSGTKIDLINTTTSGDPLKKWEQQLNPAEIKIIDDLVAARREEYDMIMKTATETS